MTDPFEKLLMMIAEEFVRQAKHQFADRVLKEASKDVTTLDRIKRLRVRAAGVGSRR